MGSESNESGDKAERFLQLFSRYQLPIRAFISTLVPSKSEGDDVMQETSMALWNKWDKYDPEKEFLPWACGMARIEVLRYRRRVATSKLWFSEELIALLATEYEKSESTHKQRLEVLPRCIERLSERDRQYITLRYQEGGTTKALVDATGKPRSSVYRHLGAIREKLRRCITTYLSTGSAPELA